MYKVSSKLNECMDILDVFGEIKNIETLMIFNKKLQFITY